MTREDEKGSGDDDIGLGYRRRSSVSSSLKSYKTETDKARNIDVNMESYYPQALDGLLNKFYIKIRTKDGTHLKHHSLRVMQAAIDRYLRHKNYPVSIITSREFTKLQETLNAEAKQLRCQGKGKRSNKAQPYSKTDKEIFW